MEKFCKIAFFVCKPGSGRDALLTGYLLFIYSKHLVRGHCPDCWHQLCLAAPQGQEIKGLNDQLRISGVHQELVENSSPLLRDLSYPATFSRYFTLNLAQDLRVTVS